MVELLEADRRIAETNALIERQRQVIEELGYEGLDATSEQIVFDSLCVSLSLQVQDRHRLHAMLQSTAVQSKHPIREQVPVAELAWNF